MKKIDVKQAELGEIREVNLQDNCDLVQYGYTESATIERVGPKFLRGTDIKTGRINWDSVPYCRIEDSNYKKYRLNLGDIVITRMGGPGDSAIIEKNIDAVFASYLIRIKVNKSFDPKYVYYFLQSNKYKSYIESIVSTSVQPGANAKQLTNVMISCPDKMKQKEIAKILSDLDEKIELNRHMNKTLESIAQAIFKRWFVDFEFPEHGKIKFVDKLPEGWHLSKLGDFAEILNGFAFKSEDFVNSGIFLLRTRNFTEDGYIIRDDSACLPGSFYDEYKDFRLKKFDVLLVMVGASVGKMAIVQSSVLPALQNQNMWNFRSKSGSGQLFLNFLVKKIVQENIGTASGSARDFFRKDYFRNIDFILPSESILKNFDKQAYSIFDRIDKNLTEMQALTQIRNSLLPRLMTGKIRVVSSTD